MMARLACHPTGAGVPVGQEIPDLEPEYGTSPRSGRDGSIIIVVATDAPVLPHQLERIAKLDDHAGSRLSKCLTAGKPKRPWRN